MKARSRKGARLRWSTLLGYASILAVLILVGYLILPYFQFHLGEAPGRGVDGRGVLRAAIVDQLAAIQPSSQFISSTGGLLRESGIPYDIYLSGDITVNFYAHLPSYGYNLIVLRVHTGVGKDFGKLGLFTDELYDPNRYVLEQSQGLVTAAQVKDGSPLYFAVTPQFIRDYMMGDLRSAIVVLGGCYGLQGSNLADAFVSKGARVVVGWDGLVDLNHTDRALQEFLKNLLLQHMNIASSVQQTMRLIGPDPVYGSQFSYYPTDQGQVTLEITYALIPLAVDTPVPRATQMRANESSHNLFSRM